MMIATFQGCAGPDIDEKAVAATVNDAHVVHLNGGAAKRLRNQLGTVAVCVTLTALQIAKLQPAGTLLWVLESHGVPPVPISMFTHTGVTTGALTT